MRSTANVSQRVRLFEGQLAGAVFGSGEQRDAGKGDDVTAKVCALIEEGKISVKVHRDIFGDPNPFGRKTLIIEHMKKGSKKILIKGVASNGFLTLP